jgi:hypothetical protein
MTRIVQINDGCSGGTSHASERRKAILKIKIRAILAKNIDEIIIEDQLLVKINQIFINKVFYNLIFMFLIIYIYVVDFKE